MLHRLPRFRGRAVPGWLALLIPVLQAAYWAVDALGNIEFVADNADNLSLLLHPALGAVLAVIGVVWLAVTGKPDTPNLTVMESGAGLDDIDIEGAEQPPLATFDPYSISSIVAGVDLAGLFRPESYALITMHVRNVSGCVVNITGVTGRILCCQEECNMPITVERAPRILSTVSSDRSAVTIRQPLSDGMMQMIALRGIQGNGTLVFSLASLKWVGTVETSAGTAPLQGCYVFQGEFVVQGPVRDANDGGTLFALPRKFVSSQCYTDDGQPREP